MTTEKKVVWMKISEVKLNPNNPRVVKDDKFKKLVTSIKNFPDMLMLRPLVVNKDNIVLGGNMRLRALQELKYNQIPVIIADNITEEQEKEFIIKDNLSFGEWDWDLLANEYNQHELVDWGLDVVTGDETTEDELSNNTTEKTIEITFTEEDYKDAVALVNYWEKNNAYVGGMVVSYLREEKKKFKKLVNDVN